MKEQEKHLKNIDENLEKLVKHFITGPTICVQCNKNPVELASCFAICKACRIYNTSKY